MKFLASKFLLSVFIIGFLMVIKESKCQYYMKTIAGIGVVTGNDNGTTRATKAILRQPVGVWSDTIGNIYFSEWGGNIVR